MTIMEGKLKGRGFKIAIVVSRFNEYITQRLLDATVDELIKHGVLKKDITVVWVPGAFELPITAQNLAKRKSIQGVIALGAVIRGETYHYELVAQGVARGIMDVSLEAGKPVIFGVLASDTIKLADKRSETKGNNKGRDAALAAIQMIDVLRQIKAGTK